MSVVDIQTLRVIVITRTDSCAIIGLGLRDSIWQFSAGADTAVKNIYQAISRFLPRDNSPYNSNDSG